MTDFNVSLVRVRLVAGEGFGAKAISSEHGHKAEELSFESRPKRIVDTVGLARVFISP